jgi:hypothetical protein
MKKGPILIGAMLMLAAQAALAQTPTPPDTSSRPPAVAPPVTPPPAAPPPVATPTPPPPAAAASSASSAAAPRPRVNRYGSISGSYLKPAGDFDNVASDGWAITLEGYQFIVPTKKIAVGSQVGYQSFGEKAGISVSNFPVDAVLKFYPKPGTGKGDVYITGGLGFNYMRTDVGFATNSDYFFGTQAGVGVELFGASGIGVVVDGVYHWVFTDGVDANFIALRAGLLVPMMR